MPKLEALVISVCSLKLTTCCLRLLKQSEPSILTPFFYVFWLKDILFMLGFGGVLLFSIKVNSCVRGGSW
jgi:hypothetical protein